jgi:predicted secreted protein
MILLDESAHGQDISVRLDDTFEISLPEIRTTGFRWAPETMGLPVCSLVGESSHPPVGAPGQAGTHVWRFRGVQRGTATILLHYRRPWEQATAPGRTFEIRVHIID